jgi:hypothetical protein
VTHLEEAIEPAPDYASADADASWHGFSGLLSSKRVTLFALVLVAAQAVMNSFVLSNGYFQQDDFVIAGLAAQRFSLHLLFQNYAGHLQPGVFALALPSAHAGYDWGLSAGMLVAFQAGAGLAVLRALRTLFGNRMLILIPLGLFLFTPMAMADLSWWAVGIQCAPLQLAIAMTVDQHVRYVRAGQKHNVAFALMWMLLGLAFSEKAVAIPLLLFALTSAFLVPGDWPGVLLTTVRRYWAAWGLYAGALVIEAVIYTSGLGSSSVQVPQASMAVAFSWDLVLRTFIPAAFGGPWRWTTSTGTPPAWSLFGYASPPDALVQLSWILAAVVVVVSLWYRVNAWRAWGILLGWLLVVDILPVALGRLAAFGAVLGTETSYVADAAPVLAFCVALAFLPLRGERRAYRAVRPRPWVRRALVGAVAVLFLASSLWSVTAYRKILQPQNSRSYVATVSAALNAAPPDAVIYQGQIPNSMAWALFGKLTLVQSVFAPLAHHAAQWTSWPVGTVNDFMIFDAQGRLHRAAVVGPHSYPFPKPADCLLTSRGMQLPLDGNLYAWPFLMYIAYYASRPVTLDVAIGSHHYQVRLAASPLANGYLPVEGPGNVVDITSVTPDPDICIGSVTVGNVVPSLTAPSIPEFPLPG